MFERASRHVIPLGNREAAAWCRDLEEVARAHGWHPHDVLFLQLGRFCLFVRGGEHRKLLHPVVLAPKQDFLSLVPVVCPPGHLTHLDAQAVTDAVASSPALTRLVGSIYCLANACEQLRNRPLPPGPVPADGLDPGVAHALQSRIAEKVNRLQDLADSTTRLLSAVFHGVSPRIVLDGPFAEISRAVEDLVGRRLASSTRPPAIPGSLTKDVSDPEPPIDPLDAIWNDVAALSDLVQSRIVSAERQRRLSAAAESLQTRVIRTIEASLTSADLCPDQPVGVDLDAFSEAVVAQVNFERVRRAAAGIQEALPAVLPIDHLAATADAIEARLAGSLGPVRAHELRQGVARTVECERAIDRTIDRLLEAGTSDAGTETELLQQWAAELLDPEEACRLVAPIRAALSDRDGENSRQALRDHCISLLLALSSRGERRLESLFTAPDLSEEDAWQAQELHRVLVGLNVAQAVLGAAQRVAAHLGAAPVPFGAVLEEKQALWGLAYEIQSWAETQRVAAEVINNTQPYSPAQGTLGTLCLASGEPLPQVLARVAGLTEPLEKAMPTPAEAPVLVSASGDVLVPERSLKVIGSVADVGTFRLSRRTTRWNVEDAAALIACSDDPFWIVWQSAEGSTRPSPAAVLDALDAARVAAESGGCTEVWCGVLAHDDASFGTLHAYRPDPQRSEAVRSAAHACETLLNRFDEALEGCFEEIEARLRNGSYPPARIGSGYRDAAIALKEFMRTFAAQHLPALAAGQAGVRAAQEVDGFVRFATRAMQDAQRQSARLQRHSARPLIQALYAIDHQRIRLRSRLHGLVRDVACEEHLLAPGLLLPVEVRVGYEAGEAATLPLAVAALDDARMAAFTAACVGSEADAEQMRRARALCELAATLFDARQQPGSAAALLLDLLRPIQTMLFGRERARPLLPPQTFDAFLEAIAARRHQLLRYLAVRPSDATLPDAVILALIIRGMGGRWASRLPLWTPVVEALRRGASLCGQPTSDLIQLSDADDAVRLVVSIASGEAMDDPRLAARFREEATRELGVDPAKPDGVAYVRDDLLAMLHRLVVRAAARLQPDRDLFLQLAAGTLTEAECQELLRSTGSADSGGRRARKGRYAAETAPADLETVRAQLAEAARRWMEYDHLAALLAPFAAGTADALYPFVLDTLSGLPAEVVRPSLSPGSPLQPAANEPASPQGEALAPETGQQTSTPGVVSALLDEFRHLGDDALAADLVEAALVIFPSDEHVRQTLAGTRKQVLDAILAREFPGVMKSTRMQIVVAAEPRGLRLHDITDLVKLVSEGGATPTEVRNLLRSM